MNKNAHFLYERWKRLKMVLGKTIISWKGVEEEFCETRGSWKENYHYWEEWKEVAHGYYTEQGKEKNQSHGSKERGYEHIRGRVGRGNGT